MTEKDYYDVLGVNKEASQEDIKVAYRKAALTHHPDKGGNADIFKEISVAYETLSNPEQRKRYDVGESTSQQTIFEMFNGMNPFGQMFGGRHQQIKRNNSFHQIQIKLSDAHTGCRKKLKVNIKKTCFDCQVPCNTCDGKGAITQQAGPFLMQNTCHACGGRCFSDRNSFCACCLGTREISYDEIVTLDIIKGVTSGQNSVAQGLGEQPRKHGELPGDLVFQILIEEDPYFKNW